MNKEIDSYIVLDSLPPYGDMYISFPSNFAGEGLVVSFMKDDGTYWVGNFEKKSHNDEDGLSFVKELRLSREILICENDKIYIFDKNIVTPIVCFQGGYVKKFDYGDFTVLVGEKYISIIKSSKEIMFLDELYYHFSSDVTFSNGIITIVTFDYNGFFGKKEIISTFNLDKLQFRNFRDSNHFKKYSF